MITNIYLLICAGIFIYINFINQGDKLSCAMKLGAFYPPNVRENKEYWRFIMCNFIHIDFLHFLMNAYAMYQIGHFFEMILPTGAYIFLVFVSMILSSLLCYSAAEISAHADRSITIGASGVVFGFFGAICALGYLVGGGYMMLLKEFFNVILINVIFTFLSPQISKTGHIGGFIGGVVSIVVLLAMKVL